MVLVVDKTLNYVRSNLQINNIPRSIKIQPSRVFIAHDGGLSMFKNYKHTFIILLIPTKINKYLWLNFNKPFKAFPFI